MAKIKSLLNSFIGGLDVFDLKIVILSATNLIFGTSNLVKAILILNGMLSSEGVFISNILLTLSVNLLCMFFIVNCKKIGLKVSNNELSLMLSNLKVDSLCILMIFGVFLYGTEVNPLCLVVPLIMLVYNIFNF